MTLMPSGATILVFIAYYRVGLFQNMKNLMQFVILNIILGVILFITSKIIYEYHKLQMQCLLNQKQESD